MMIGEIEDQVMNLGAAAVKERLECVLNAHTHSSSAPSATPRERGPALKPPEAHGYGKIEPGQTGSTDRFRLGVSLPPGALLERIDPDRVRCFHAP